MTRAPHNDSESPAAPADPPKQRDAYARFRWAAAILVVGLAALVFPGWTRLQRANTVVVYCAQDQEYAEPIFRDFEQKTGVRVLPVYDSEAVKTVGLANRLLAERERPRADLFWGNEELRARQLAARGVFVETNGLGFFGFRTRRLVINTNLWAGRIAELGLASLTNHEWRGKLALAYPQFGTTAAHFHVLRQKWGESAWRSWCQNLARNEVRLVDGNSVVVKLVGAGEAWIGMTDSDDILAGRREGLPIAALPLNGDALHIPNSLGLVRGAPHPDSARRLFEYLLQERTAAELVRAGALEGVTAPNRAAADPQWERVLQDLDVTTEELNRIFLR